MSIPRLAEESSAACSNRDGGFTYPMKRRIPTVNVPVAMTVPTIHQMSLVSRFAICVDRRLPRFAISVRTSARPVLNWSEVTWLPCSTPSRIALALTSA